MSGHTQTPIRLCDAEGRVILDAEGMTLAVALVQDMGSDQAHEFAALIVRAVNAHEGLVGALRDAEERLAAIGERLNGDVSQEDILAAYRLAYPGNARAALAGATE